MTAAAVQVLISHGEAERRYELQRAEHFSCTEAAWLQLHHGVVPQASAARWLDLQLSPHRVRALVAVPVDLPCFEGHFPGQPLLPGVLQLVWTRELLDCWQPGVILRAVKQLKFRQRIEPPAVLRLELHRSPGKIAARIERPAGTVADWVFVHSPPDSSGAA